MGAWGIPGLNSVVTIQPPGRILPWSLETNSDPVISSYSRNQARMIWSNSKISPTMHVDCKIHYVFGGSLKLQCHLIRFVTLVFFSYNSNQFMIKVIFLVKLFDTLSPKKSSQDINKDHKYYLVCEGWSNKL